METYSVFSQQLQTILVIAMVANVVLITIALASMRSSGARARKEGGLAATSGSMPALTTASAAVPDPAAATMAGGMEPSVGASGASSSDWGTEGTADVEADGETPGGAVVLLDPATGLESPIVWRRALEDEFLRIARYHRPATVMIIELDGFDRLVERLGEAAGARIVLATARTIRAEARAADRCARLGRGRFAVLLPETDEVKAINFVERVRSECDRWLETGEIALRLAIGWVILDPSEDAAAAVQEAQRRLDSERRLRTSPAG